MHTKMTPQPLPVTLLFTCQFQVHGRRGHAHEYDSPTLTCNPFIHHVSTTLHPGRMIGPDWTPAFILLLSSFLSSKNRSTFIFLGLKSLPLFRGRNIIELLFIFSFSFGSAPYILLSYGCFAWNPLKGMLYSLDQLPEFTDNSCVLLFAKGRIVPISKASEWPSDYHPYCGLTSGSSKLTMTNSLKKSAAGWWPRIYFLK